VQQNQFSGVADKIAVSGRNVLVALYGSLAGPFPVSASRTADEQRNGTPTASARAAARATTL
jgi:hypothetical protein